MIVIGLTGSIGMGKSTVAEIFREAGLPIFSADAALHQLMDKNGAAVEEIRRYFPECVKDGAVDRTTLGAIIFGEGQDEAARLQKQKQLEAILHPLARQKAIEFIDDYRARNARGIVLEIPLLFEGGANELCDPVICVTASYETQRERVLIRPGMTEEKFQKILTQQMPDAQKRERADYVVRTDCPIEETRAQVLAILQKLIL